MRGTAKSKTAVWRWQERFAQAGVDGLLRDKTRPSRVKPFGREVAERIVALTFAEPPGETAHWTGRAMAKVTGVSLSYVQRIWRSYGLQPHRIRTFKPTLTKSSLLQPEGTRRWIQSSIALRRWPPYDAGASWRHASAKQTRGANAVDLWTT